MTSDYTSRNLKSQSGNVLFFILIAVVLFAALSYVVAGMMRSGDPSTIHKEKAVLYASELLDYARAMRNAVQNMRINGCNDLDISFTNTTVSGYTHTPAVSDTCQLFDLGKGGGVSYSEPDSNWLDNTVSGPPALWGEWYFPANVCVQGIGTSGSGTTCDSDSTDNEDLIAILPYIRSDLCTRINEVLNVSPASEVGAAWPAANTKFTGSMADDTILNQSGLMAGCFESGGSYHFFQVLKAR